MAQLQINLDGLRVHLDYLQDEKHRIRLLQAHLENYIYKMQSLGNQNFYFFKEQFNTLKKLEENIDGRISFLEGLIQSHYSLTNDISQQMQEMKNILSVIEEE